MNKKDILYSSEIKALLTDKSPLLEWNKDSILEYFTYSFILGNKTFFKRIEVLPPASFQIINKEGKKMIKYYVLKRRDREKFNLNSLISEFSTVMLNSVKKRMEDKKKIGILLSGGLDSRLLAGFAKQIALNNNINLISFTFGTKGGWQEKIAKKVAKRLKIENIFLPIPIDMISNYAEEVVYKGDGLIRIRDAHFISLLGEIQSQVDIILTGLFCSELFGETLAPNLLKIPLKSTLINYLFNFSKVHNISHHIPKLFSKSFQLNSEKKIKEFFTDTFKEITVDSNDEIAHQWEILQWCRRYILPISTYMSWYLETRLPFLDNDVLDFALQLPYELKFKKKFIEKANRLIFPLLANIPLEKTGLPPDYNKALVNFYKKARLAKEHIKKFIEKISLNKVLFRSLDYRAYDYFLRTGSKKYVLKSLIVKNDDSIWNRDYLKRIIKEHMSLKENHEQIIIDVLQIHLINRLFFH